MQTSPETSAKGSGRFSTGMGRSYPALFLFALFLMVAGDFPRFPFGIEQRHLVLLIFSWPKLYLVFLLLSFLCLVFSGKFEEARSKETLLSGPLRVPILATAACFLLSALSSEERALSLKAAGLFGAGLLLIYFLSLSLAREDLRVGAWRVLQIAVLFLAVRVISWRLAEGMHVGAYHVKNNSWLGKIQIAWVLNFAAPFFFIRFLPSGMKLERALNGFLWLLCGVAIYILFSRAGTIALSATVLILCGFYYRRWKRWVPLLLIYGVFLLPILWRGRVMSAYVVQTASQFYEESGFLRRRGIWKETLRMFLDHPLFGIGPGTYDEIAYSRYHTPYDLGSGNHFYRSGWHAHNVFLHVLAETGLAGFLSWISIHVCVFFFLLRKWKSNPSSREGALAVACCLIAFLVLGSTENVLAVRVHESFRMNLTFWFLILFGLNAARTENAGPA